MAKQDRTITVEQLHELFRRHCECRPFCLTRTENDHSHDCDTGILHDVQLALGIIRFDDIGRSQTIRQACARCAEYLTYVKNAHGGWSPP